MAIDAQRTKSSRARVPRNVVLEGARTVVPRGIATTARRGAVIGIRLRGEGRPAMPDRVRPPPTVVVVVATPPDEDAVVPATTIARPFVAREGAASIAAAISLLVDMTLLARASSPTF